MPNDFFTLQTLATFAGMVAAVAIIVQFTKGFFKASVPDWAVRLYTLVIALIVMFFVLYVQKLLTVESIGLGIINSVLVAMTAMGAYEVVADPGAQKRLPQKVLPSNKDEEPPANAD